MGAAAVLAGKAVGYYNAGTVEFIYQDGEFFFLEMNTRLQVEHPVTEAITGIDLVEWQIRVASGEPLPMTQDEVLAQRRGHAIEVRINAEDPAGGAFLPSPGRITRLHEPHGFGVRFDSGYRAGDEVSQYYDNLVAKLVVWGKDRPTAIARTISALRGDADRGRRHDDPRRRGDPASSRLPQRRALDEVGRGTPRPDRGRCAERSEPPGRRRRRRAAGARPTHDHGRGQRQALRRVAVGSRRRRRRRRPRQSGAPSASRAVRRGASAGGVAGSGDVTVPMQGTIVKVLVEVGQQVAAGQAIVVLEAMKMENQITAEREGTVKEIKVAAGDTVGGGDVVAVIE